MRVVACGALGASLSLLAASSLWQPDGDLRLRVDASAAALAAEPAEDSGVIVALFSVDQAWSADQLIAIAELGQGLSRNPLVARVESPVNVRLPVLLGDAIDVASLGERLRAQPDKASWWIEHAFSEPLVAERLVSADRRQIGMLLSLQARDGAVLDAMAVELAGVIRTAADELAGVTVTVTGSSLLSLAIGQQILEDLVRILVLGAGLFLLVLILSFRPWYMGVLPLVAIGLSILWTLAIMVWLDISLNLVTAIVPPLVMTLGLAFALHVLFALSSSEPAEIALRHLRLPLVVSAITTMVGFLALGIDASPALRGFAAAGAIGIAAAALATYCVLVPLVLLPGAVLQSRSWLERHVAPLGRRLGVIAVRRSRLVKASGLIVVAVGLLGAWQVQSGSHYVDDLRADHPARQAYQQVNTALDGANGFDIRLFTGVSDGALLPDALAAAEALQVWLNQRPEVSGSQSLVDVLKRLNQIFEDGSAQAYRIPQGVGLAKQLMLLGAPPEAAQYTNLAYSDLIIRVRTPLDDTAALGRLFAAIQVRLQDLPPGLSAELRGNAVSLTRTVEDLTRGQLRSLAVALLAIFTLLSVLFASLRMGMLAMLPNLVPIAAYFGLMGLLQIPLGPTTALVGCIVLGIAVDDTVFYLVRFNRAARAAGKERRATVTALNEVIRPITLTSMTLILGFLLLTTSSFQSQVLFALLAAATLAVAWLSDVTLTPAVAARSSIVTLWDVLKLDLGASPEKTIPVLRGMSPRQARLCALLARTRYCDAGHLLIRRGDVAREIFVVIDGILQVWIEDHGQRCELNRLGRGDSVGESGPFAGTRSANVSALTDAYLLVFDVDALARIERRYPRIASKLYKNLNRIQAMNIHLANRMLVATPEQPQVA